jgi:hypothetical protein
VQVTVPTISPVVPPSELDARLAALLTSIYKNEAVAKCVVEQLRAQRDSGAVTATDIDNYLRNVTTDGMRAALVKIQDSGKC